MKMNEKKSPRSSIVAPFLLLKKMVNFFLSFAKTKKLLQSIAIQKKNIEKLLNVPGVCYTVLLHSTILQCSSTFL